MELWHIILQSGLMCALQVTVNCIFLIILWSINREKHINADGLPNINLSSHISVHFQALFWGYVAFAVNCHCGGQQKYTYLLASSNFTFQLSLIKMTLHYLSFWNDKGANHCISKATFWILLSYFNKWRSKCILKQINHS